MLLFFIGLVILVVGCPIYGRLCTKVFRPDGERKTAAVAKADGVDYVPMKTWKNSLVQLLNIAGTGPILGPIQGILFGPIAFILIPIGNLIGGAVHDYMTGMISLRNDGMQPAMLAKKYLGRNADKLALIFIALLLLLVGTVFIYTPGDIFVTQVLGQKADTQNWIIWAVYGLIIAYYLVATLFPIDKIIGRIYPVLGGILLLSTIGVFIMMIVSGWSLEAYLPTKENLIPMFFVTVACGITSGFHFTQSTIIARSVTNERQGRTVFYDMMVVEGFIAMVWAAAALGVYNSGIDTALIGTPSVVGVVAKELFGPVGAAVAIIGVIILPITSGDTALRGLRITIAEQFGIDQRPVRNRLLVAGAIFAAVIGLLIFSKVSSGGFTLLWQYFGWSNQVLAVIGFSIATVYLIEKGRFYIITLIPGTFYAFIIASYIVINSTPGFGAAPVVGYIAGGVFAAAYAAVLLWYAKRRYKRLSCRA